MRSIICSKSQVLFLCSSVFVLSVSSPAQDVDSLIAKGYEKVAFPILPQDTLVQLAHQFIVPGSEAVSFDSTRLTAGIDYRLEARLGRIILMHRLSPDTSIGHVMTIYYRNFPFSFKETYRHRIPVTLHDTQNAVPPASLKTSSGFSIDDLFGSDLQKSGSIVRGFTVGTNRDLSLSSGLRMQMSGSLTNDIQVIAALTDENSPIQPEGTTQTLQEIDKVFVELRGETMAATLGDFNLAIEGNEFGRINRKLQGAKGSISYGDRTFGGNLLLSGALSRGKFTTNQFPGVDGVQGPYRLSGRNNERNIIVVAGTEKVYLNGELMARGEVGDYVIDYATAEVTFTYRRLISSASRITADFEYSDREYPRNLVAGRAGTSFINNKVSFAATFIREGDDENSPIDEALSDADKDTLRAAGAERSKARRSGAVYVGPGKGQYLQVDTLILSSQPADTLQTSFFRFAPDSASQAPYAVTFSYVGSNRGDYEKVTLNHYRFVGIGTGSYAPFRLLPMPQATSLADFDLAAALGDDLTLSGEYAHTNFNANKFSAEAHEDGSALKLALRLAPKRIRLAGIELGSADLQFKERFIGAAFVAIDRFNDIEFSRKWDLSDSSKNVEEMHEGSIAFQPSSSIAFNASVGSLSRGDDFSSNRYTGRVGYHAGHLPDAGYSFELIESRNTRSDRLSSWFRHHASVKDTCGVLSPALRYDGEILWSKSKAADTVRQGSFRFHEVAPALVVGGAGRSSFAAEVGWRWDDSLKDGAMRRVSTTFAQQYHANLQEWNALTTSMDVAIRERSFTQLFKQGNDERIQTVLLRSQTRFNPFDRAIESEWFYEAASERSARLERAFQPVQRGTGNYVYAGDLNNNHLADPEEFQLSRFDGDFIAVMLPTDDLIPVVDLKASTRFRLNGSRIAHPASWLERMFSLLSAETYLRLDEKSSAAETRDIYLLHLSRFLDDRTTLVGSNLVTQDIHLRENDPQFSVRLRYVQRHGLTQFALQKENTYMREQSTRLRWQLVKEIANQVDVVRKVDDLSSTSPGNRVRRVASTSVLTAWSYRFPEHIELGFSFGFGSATNFDSTQADFDEQRVKVTYAIAERAQATAEFAREEVLLARPQATVPFELTGGRLEGRTWLWQAALEYRISQFVQASLNYDGRNEGGHGTIHTVRASVRAFF